MSNDWKARSYRYMLTLRVESLAQGLHDVLRSVGLRDDLRARGLRRAAQFSWDRCAAETLAVYAAARPARLKR